MAELGEHRQMVDELKDQPFAFIGINTDKMTQAEFVERAQKEGINFRNALMGSTSNELSRRWNVTYYPTIYVIDANGVIRFKDTRGEDLRKAVHGLLGSRK